MRAAPAATASVARIRLFFIIDRYFFRGQASLMRSVPLFLIGTNGTRRRRFKITSGASYTETVRLGLRLPSPPHSPVLSTASRAIIISSGAATCNPMTGHRPHTSSPHRLSCVTLPPATYLLSPYAAVCCGTPGFICGIHHRRHLATHLHRWIRHRRHQTSRCHAKEQNRSVGCCAKAFEWIASAVWVSASRYSPHDGKSVQRDAKRCHCFHR